MGTGGLGGYYGGVLAQRGHEVTFVARGAHLAAMRERGLELRSGGQTTLLHPVRAVGSPADAGSGFDLVLFTVKTYDTEAAAAALRPALGPATAVLPLQNGVDSVERLSRALGADRVLVGTTLIGSVIVEPGVIDQSTALRRITLGEQSGEVTPRVEAIAAALRDAGVEVTTTADPLVPVWEKFVMFSACASVGSAAQAPFGPIRETPEGLALVRALLAEAIAVGRASGVALPDAVFDRSLETFMALPPTHKTSMQRDYERRGRVELEGTTGTVVRRGRELGVPTPVHDVLYAVLKVRAAAFGGL
jgi:2-dehydropantoate 2-reductase